ncbi:MAG TPA: DUF488 domain-containing protein [Gammaproteobacteria bacterium]|nr:DUF488 domain-containing protein [Gammaproteobacteria bacterium]
MREIYTIGHSNHPIEKLVALLAQHGVELVADVRSHPASRFNPQFNRERLRASLAAAGVDYELLGRELGARSTDDGVYVDGKVDYDRLARTTPFREGIVRVSAAAATRRVALLCAEKDPIGCHRAILVCPALAARGFAPLHIHSDGRLETDAELGERLLAELGLAEGDLFRDRAALLAEAYRRRGRELGYERRPGTEIGPARSSR